MPRYTMRLCKSKDARSGGGPILTPSYVSCAAPPATILGGIAPAIDGGIVAEQNESRLFRIKEDHLPGDLGFDPLGLKPTNDKDLKSMASKELNNGRLAMIGIAGMVAQELVSGMKI